MRLRSVLAALAVLPLLVTACGNDDDDNTASDVTEADDGGAATEAQKVTFVAEDYAYTEAPAIDAGVVQLTLENTGKVAHEVSLVEIGDAPIADFPADFAGVLEGGPFPEYAGAVMSYFEVEGGASDTVTFTIDAGTYALFCTLDGDADAPAPVEGEESEPGEPHITRGMIQSFTVGDGDDDAVLPEADGSITASDYTFDVAVAAGDKTINFVNDGPDQVHFAGISVFPEGTTAAQAEDAFGVLLAAGEGAPPEGTLQPEDFGYSGVVSAGLGIQFELPAAFESGRTYLVVCYISDRAGGPPHAIAHKMYKAFTVT